MYSRSLSGAHKTRYRKILRGHHDVDICFIQDMWGKAMHMHCAADLVSGESVWLKKTPRIFFLCGCRIQFGSCLRHVMRTKSGSLYRIFLHHGNKIRCIIENRMV